MSAVNTDTDTILEVLNDKMDRDGNNLNQSAIDFDVVVEWQTPTAANSYTWYRKYASGWVEQGGITPSDANNITVSLPVEMANTNYYITAAPYRDAPGTSGASDYGLCVGSKTTTTFFIVLQQAFRYTWEAKGMAASVA